MIGFHFSHEQLPPSALLRHATLTAAAGFTAGMCSDHLRPWSERQGHSGYAWSWLGAALEATPMSFGTVCAPGQRYHPVVIAQASATLAEMYEGRFWLALGSGEALNEAVTGDRWPSKPDRNARLKQCVDVIRALWAGDTVSTHGHITTESARIYVKPSSRPLIVGAALSPGTARWVASWADALITVNGPRDTMRAVVDAFREGGGEGKPMFLQVALSYAPTEEEARQAACDQWAQAALTREQIADLPTPEDFDRATAGADAERILRGVRVSADLARHAEWLREDQALGFDRIYLHTVARERQAMFIEHCGERLLPQFSAVGA